ncbi:MAG: AAA family ATPase [Acidobacteriota bacterium]
MSAKAVDLIRTLGGGDLEQRLQEAAQNVGVGPLSEADLVHLVRILTNNSLVVTPIFELIKFHDLIDAHFHPGALQLLTATAEDDQALHRLLAVPDHVRVLGDKCLFETGVARRKGPSGLDFEELGQRSYEKASQVLDALSRDPRLREFYEQNTLNTMALEDEVAFLEHCAEVFALHVKLFHELLDQHRPEILHANSEEQRDQLASALGRRRDSERASLVPLKTELPDDGTDTVRDDVDEVDDDRPEAPSLQLVSRTQEEEDEIRFRELMAAEKIVLFSALDTELLRDELKKVVIRQDPAIDSLCDELSLYATGTQDPRKPASFFLIGPTGVGKNYLVESTLRLFEKLWGIEVPYLELEGPEFTYPSDINELKGAARGFIRSDEEGLMTQFHSRAHDKPISVMLIDEVEKAHPQLRRFFLPIMDRGTMTDNRGKVLHFENSLIFFTSNIGYSDASQRTAPIGYGTEESKEREEEHFVLSRVRKTLSPEFINRVHLVHFQHLTRDAVDEIFDLELEKIANRYAVAQEIDLRVSEAARREILERGYHADYGARNLAKELNRCANIEVSKVLKRDEDKKMGDVTPTLQLIRDMREGRRPYDGAELQEAVEACSRIQVPYRTVTIDWTGGEFTYERG